MAGVVSGNERQRPDERRGHVATEERAAEDERDDREEAEEARVLLRLAIAGRDGADGREDGAVREVAEHEVGEREDEHRRRRA